MRYGYNIVLVICICSLVPAYADLLQRVMTPYAKYPYADMYEYADFGKSAWA